MPLNSTDSVSSMHIKSSGFSELHIVIDATASACCPVVGRWL